MKHILYILAILLCAVCCTDNKESDSKLPFGYDAPKKLNASIEPIESRTVVSNDRDIRWKSADKIAYFHHTNYNLQYRLYSTETSSRHYSIFMRMSESAGEGEPLNYVYAVYPYAEDIAVSNEGKISIRLSETQSYAEKSFGVGAVPMVAVAEGKENEIMQFRSVVGFLKLQLYSSDMVVKRVELCGNSGEKLAGKATIIAEYGSNPIISTTDLSVEKISLDCGEGVKLGKSATEATAFWFALPQMEFADGFTITIYDADNTPYIKTISESFVVERNVVRSLKAFDAKADTDISEEEGKVLFYLSERSDGLRAVSGAEDLDWTNCVVSVNGEVCSVEQDSFNKPYIRVNVNADGVYKAVLHTAGSEKWQATSPYKSVILPCSQFDSRALADITSLPMYATYSKANGRNLVFDYGVAFLRLKLRGNAKIKSVRVESPTRYDLSGVVPQAVADKGEYKVDKGMNFVALNCVNGGEYVALSRAKAHDFYLMIAPGEYSDGLRVSVCDTDFRASFYDLPNLTLKAGDIHLIEQEYKPSEDLVFYEGFDNCVWGGDIMRGSEEGLGFAPNSNAVTTANELDRDGYADALAMVPYNRAGTAFVQSNNWEDVSPYTVATSHQLSDSYMESRVFSDYRYLYRTQEYPGFIAVGAGNRGRGICRLPYIRNIKGIGTYKLTLRFAMKAGYSDELDINFVNGGRIVSATLDGVESSAPIEFVQTTSSITIPKSDLIIPTSEGEKRVWQTLELVVADAADGSRIDIRSYTATLGVHGIYIDSIEAHQLDEWRHDALTLRVLMWNIQNGMWADQHNNYDNFVEWVKRWNPDICVWCESETIYTDKTDSSSSNRYLPDGWGELAARYGHSYTAIGGNNSNYSQTVTSKYPISILQQMTKTDAGKTLTRGAGYFIVVVNGKKVNVVTLHLWPKSYAPGVSGEDKQAESTANYEGAAYRQLEMQYIVDQTVNNEKYAAEKYWLFGGDTNARSRLDAWHYGYEDTDYRFWANNIILDQTNLKDVIGHFYPGYFYSSTMGDSRIDIMYASPAMYSRLIHSTTLVDYWLTGCKKSEYVDSFYDRSDHRPIMMEFDMAN